MTSSSNNSHHNSTPIQHTNLEATLCKYTLLYHNYISQDPYLPYFVNSSSSSSASSSSSSGANGGGDSRQRISAGGATSTMASNSSSSSSSAASFRTPMRPPSSSTTSRNFPFSNTSTRQPQQQQQQQVPNNGAVLEMNPLMLRGYWSRIWSIHQVLDCFLNHYVTNASSQRQDTSCQIINLGCGFDTLFWKLAERYGVTGGDEAPNQQNDTRNLPFKLLELDFPSVTRQKRSIILKNDQLQAPLVSTAQLNLGQDSLVSQNYVLRGCDLRDTESYEGIIKQHLDPSKPTIILSEVALIYMEPKYSDAIIAANARLLECSWFILYEQMNPNDSFGSMMVNKLRARGCPLLSIEAYPSAESQEKRLRTLGYTDAHACDMNAIYDSFLDPKEKMRIQRLHLFDEFEEWHLIQSHYFLLIAYKDSRKSNERAEGQEGSTVALHNGIPMLRTFWNLSSKGKMQFSAFM